MPVEARDKIDNQDKFEKNDEGLYQCQSCDFSSKSKQGVKQHTSKMHKMVVVDIELIEKEVAADLEAGGITELDPNLAQSFQEEFNLDVFKMYKEKENELTIASVKIADLEQKLRQKEVELENRDGEHLEEIRKLKANLASKDELLQTALAEEQFENKSRKCGLQ